MQTHDGARSGIQQARRHLEVTHRIEADRRIYVISDLHLGDGTRSDAFLGKDRELLRLIARVREEDAHLVLPATTSISTRHGR